MVMVAEMAEMGHSLMMATIGVAAVVELAVTLVMVVMLVDILVAVPVLAVAVEEDLHITPPIVMTPKEKVEVAVALVS